MNLIGVNNLENARKFYEDILGFEIIEYKPPSFMEAKLPDGSIYNIETQSDERAEGFKEMHVGGIKSCVFMVDDINGFAQYCRDNNVKIIWEPVLQSFGWWTMRIADPDGNEFNIEQET